MRPIHDDWLLPTLEGLVDADALAELKLQATESLWVAVIKRGLVSEGDLLFALSSRYRMPIANVGAVSVEARELVPEALARRYGILPLTCTPSTLDIATSDPNDLDCERSLAFATGRTVRMLLASPTRVAERIEEIYRPDNAVEKLLEGMGHYDVQALVEEIPDVGDLDLGADRASDRPIIRLVDHIVAEGITLRASDIHLETQEGGVFVHYRVDGVLRKAMQLPRSVGVPLVSRIKIMSGLDIADRLRPQDGRARVSVNGKRVDMRVSTLPASTGEKVVIRILDASGSTLSLDALGLTSADLERVEFLANLREGIVLVTGPTGSGKTTTLYSSLRTIQTRGVNIVTVEDPVEYKLTGIVQVQVNEKAGLTFAAALRSILRQDPDVVLVGEIRDRETAGIAIQASLTGHLVLSTLHTIDAASSIARLLDIGVESFKIAAAIKGVVAQRLLRRLCTSCRTPLTEPLPEKTKRWFPDGIQLYRAASCPDCGNTGYRGRLAIMEVLVSDPEVERRIAANEPTDRIHEAAQLGGMRSLWESGVDHVIAGLTDVDELLRVLEVPEIQPARRAPETRQPLSPPAVQPLSSVPVAPVRNPTPIRPMPAYQFLPDEVLELVDDGIPGHGAKRAGKHTVLLVEDEDTLRTVLKDILEREGYSVVEAADGIEALEEIDRSAPDMVVLDLHLPRLDGFGVLSHLRARASTAKLPVVVLTARGDEENEVRVFEAGANDFLTKPFRPRALTARLRAIMMRRV